MISSAGTGEFKGAAGSAGTGSSLMAGGAGGGGGGSAFTRVLFFFVPDFLFLRVSCAFAHTVEEVDVILVSVSAIIFLSPVVLEVTGLIQASDTKVSTVTVIAISCCFALL